VPNGTRWQGGRMRGGGIGRGARGGNRAAACVITVLAALCLPAAAHASFTIQEYPTPTAGSDPMGIALGSDGNIWFTEHDAGRIARVTPGGVVTEYPLDPASEPTDITAGPDGNLWFTEYAGNQIGRITTSGTITEFPVPTANSGPGVITDGPDGRLWFTEGTVHRMGRITTAGTFLKTFKLPSTVQPQAITSGPDGNVWFSEPGLAKIGQITTTGTVTEFPTGIAGDTRGIAPGPDGNLWFTDQGTNSVGRITTSGTVTEFLIPTANALPSGITPGPDGNLWYDELDKDAIGQVSTGGTTLTESTTPSSGVEPYGVAPGADGNIWLTELTGGAVGRLTLPHLNISNVYYIPNRFFIPNIAHVQNRGDTVSWLVLAPGTRGIIDTTGLNLYGTSPAGGPTATAIGGIFSFRFSWAGMYSYDDPFHTGSRGRVSVPIGVSRVRGTTDTARVTWASGDAPAGDVFDVEVQVPGSAGFVPWRSGVTSLSDTFASTDTLWAGPGTYRFEARLRNASSGAASGFSAPHGISLS
jgi:streptogramin lyase